MTEYLTMDEYLILSQKTIGKYAPRLLKSQDYISDVAYMMMVADTKFNGHGSRAAFRVYYGKFAIKTIVGKIKRDKNRKTNTLSLDSTIDIDDTFCIKESIKNNIPKNIDINLLLKHCPEKYRKTITQYFLDGDTLRNIADKEGVSFQAISDRIKNAVKKIKESINESQLTINDFIN